MPYAFSAFYRMQLRRHGNFSTRCASPAIFFLRFVFACHLLLECASFDPIFKHVSIILQRQIEYKYYVLTLLLCSRITEIQLESFIYFSTFSVVTSNSVLCARKEKHINCTPSKLEYTNFRSVHFSKHFITNHGSLCLFEECWECQRTGSIHLKLTVKLKSSKTTNYVFFWSI